MDVLQPLTATLFVMALLGGALMLLRKRGAATIRFPAAGARRLQVVERVSLGPHHGLHLVQMGDRTILVATAPNSCQLLDALPAGEGE
jgi:flagellar biogenesis protein FliO